MSVEKILVGTDFSPSSDRALGCGVALAERLNAELSIVYAFNPTGFPVTGDDESVGVDASWLGSMRGFAVDGLEGCATRARERGVRVSTRIESGAASTRLLDAARSDGASLIVVGRRGQARLPHVRLGSVTERLVRSARTPVLVVPLAAPAELEVPERLLVGVDFSSASAAAARFAGRLSHDLGSPGGLALLHAYRDEREMWLADWSELLAERDVPYKRSALRDWAALHVPKGVPCDYEFSPAVAEKALLEAAQQEGCSWIVVGLQGRTALAAFLIGSTTDRVLKLADRPVLVVPSDPDSPGDVSS